MCFPLLADGSRECCRSVALHYNQTMVTVQRKRTTSLTVYLRTYMWVYYINIRIICWVSGTYWQAPWRLTPGCLQCPVCWPASQYVSCLLVCLFTQRNRILFNNLFINFAFIYFIIFVTSDYITLYPEPGVESLARNMTQSRNFFVLTRVIVCMLVS